MSLSTQAIVPFQTEKEKLHM